jgi:hypothetical protein
MSPYSPGASIRAEIGRYDVCGECLRQIAADSGRGGVATMSAGHNNDTMAANAVESMPRRNTGDRW